MVGNVVAVGAHGAELLYHRLPEVGGSGYCSGIGHHRVGYHRVFGCLCHDGLFFLLILILLLLFHYGTLSLDLQRDLRGRQTRRIVAGTILEIAVDVVLGFSETDFLHEGDGTLKVAQLHLEEFVELFDFLASGLQLSYRLGTLHLHHVEGGGDGAVVAKIGGIDMPAWIDGGGEYELALAAFQFLQLRSEMNGLHHLSRG